MKVAVVLVVKTSLIFASDWGWWGVEASSRGIAQVVLPQRSSHQVRKQLGNEENSASPLAEEAARQIQEYLYGQRQHFTVPVDWEPILGFARHILEACAQIPYGETVSYAELARRAGKEGAGRAVGQALAANPVPILVPCHRVICVDGSLGGFSGGLEMKRRLLELEGGWPLHREGFGGVG